MSLLPEFLLRRLDAATRRDIFEPALYEALADHAEACAGARPLHRGVRQLILRGRALAILAQSLRLQARRERYRATGKDRIMRTFWKDVRHAARGLRRRPAFATVAIFTLALGIGANAAVFSVVNSVLLRPLPYAEAERLVVVWGDNRTAGSDRDPHAPETFQDYRSGLEVADVVTGISPHWNFTLIGGESPERVSGYYASAELLPMLGAVPVVGRLLEASDDRPDAAAAAVISYALWQRRFGGSPDVVGQALRTTEGDASIVGVLPADFRWREDADVWLPLALNSFWTTGARRVRLYEIVARRAPGVTLEQFRTRADAIASSLAADFPENLEGISARVVSLHDDVVGSVRPILFALVGAVGLVLLIACANVANLMLVRGDGRRREIAVRAALGASRGRLARALLAEGALLALAGGLVGFVLAFAGVRAIMAFVPPAIPRSGEVSVDPRVLGFSFVLALVTGLLFSLVPLFESMRAQPGDSLKETDRATGGSRSRVRSILVVSEIALAVIVAVGALLLVRSFSALQNVDPGFTTENLLYMDLSGLPREPVQQIALMERIHERLNAVPGVLAAGEVSRVPLDGSSNNITSSLGIERRPVPANEQPEIDFRRASRGYFDAMRIPLLRGRGFESEDGRVGAERVTLINEVAAQRYFPNEDPIGQRVSFGGGGWATIVGIVGAIRHTTLAEEPRPEAYLHTIQGPVSNPRVLVRTAGAPLAQLAAVRAAIQEQDPNLVVSRVTTMEQMRDASLATPRFNTLLFALFAVLALALATIGTYGVMAYTVAQRTREIGVRMSLGARPGDVSRMVVREGLVLAAIGLSAGIVTAILVTGTMRGLLFGVSPTDPAAFAGSSLLLVTAVLAACWITARRAAAIDPVRALRQE